VASPDLVEFRDLSLHTLDGREHGEVEITVDPHVPPARHAGLEREVRATLLQEFPELEMDVLMKVDFSARPMTA
jgi:divalent metal cation (Fe/Co/Zn/Cd) transporter